MVDATPSHVPAEHVARPRTPTIGLALGGGGARGLAHLLMLEAFDELGVRPSIIAGTSIGAIFGAAYASGIAARDIRAHAAEVLSQRFSLLRDVFSARLKAPQRSLNPFNLLGSRGAFLDPMMLMTIIAPNGQKASFGELEIPLRIIASDFYDQEAVVFSSGPLQTAVAASMALPVLFAPVVIGGRAYIDGGLTNPLPFDVLAGLADVIVAIDVSGVPVQDPRRPHPTAFEALFQSAFLFERSIVREKLRSSQPDILVHAGTGRFLVLDFLKIDEILKAAEPAKDKLKAQLDRILSVETLPELSSPPASPDKQPAPPKRLRRSGLLRRR